MCALLVWDIFVRRCHELDGWTPIYVCYWRGFMSVYRVASFSRSP